MCQREPSPLTHYDWRFLRLLRINNIKISPCEKYRFNDKSLSKQVVTEIKNKLLKKLRISEDRLLSLKVIKQSIDARKKDDVKVIFSIDVQIKDEAGYLKRNQDRDIVFLDKDSINRNITNPQNESMMDFNSESESLENQILSSCHSNNKNEINKIIVVGAGPAGLFCALKLAQAGLHPILIERGEDVEKRLKSVNDFWQGKPLDPSSNVQFGEGGAGTFSDGKLNTMVKDSGGRMSEVYRIFVEHGADENILYLNKPHIGTDRLKEIVKNIRKHILELGGEIKFSTQVTDVILDHNKSVKGVVLSDGSHIDCEICIFAIGHSARDTFEMLEQKGIAMEQKPFAMGVRVQHPREYIDSLQYGKFHEYLPAADYKLTYTKPGERSVYSFCMCPGGYVVNASSEQGRLAVNGMSYSGRDSAASNSAIVVQVNTADFPGEDVLAGVRLQRKLEEAAFKACDGKIPVQYLKCFETGFREKHPDAFNDIVTNEISSFSSEQEFFKENNPECKGLWQFCDLNTFLPDYIGASMLKAFPYFGNLMKGFNAGNTLLLGLESRTSSPVRIVRGENLQSTNTAGLYPCGEGAGYAGGITSAAMDGLKVADKIIDQSEGRFSD